MAKRTIPALLLFFCLIPPSLLFSQGRSSPIDAISAKFVKYCQAVPREEVFIHTDREEYIAGEDIWFKVYVIDRQSNTISPLSKLVYFEILNSDNIRVASRRIKVQNGAGPSHVVLPDTLTSGNYTLLAYTNWMRNFFPQNCFRKNIDVYNALNNRNFKIRVGQPTNSSQTNVDRNNSVNSSGRLSMKVDNSEVESIRLSLLADNIYLNNNGTLCYLFIQTRGNINYTGSVSLSGDSAMVSIPRQNLNQGINHITIFNFEGKPVLEKYIFNPVYDKNDISVRVSGKTGVRDYISVEFELPGKQGQQSDTGGLSISVAPADGSDNQDIADYMIFGSEFGVLPEKISSRSKNDIPSGEMNEFLSSVRSNWIDWNVILSDKVPAYRFQIEKEDHFLTGRLLNIETGNPASGEYIFLSRPGKKASFRYARSDKDGFFTFNLPISEELQDIVIQPEKADKNYKIRLESAFPEELIQAGKSKVVDIERASQKISELSANYQVRKIYGISSTGKASVPEKPLPSFSRFYGKPDAAINMDDYIKLPVMQEVFFELLPGVSLKSRKASYEFSINDLIVNNLDIKPPGMLIDGVVVNNAASIAGLDPELVERIEVVEEPYLVGRYIFYGLISIITRKGDFNCISLPDYAIRLSYRVNDTVPSFISPDYSAVTEKQSTIPDFRNTLYWNPSVEPGKGGKAEVGFWTSDYVADYVINIQGIDENGHLVSSRKILRIDQPRRN